jgi:hypothetical protein
MDIRPTISFSNRLSWREFDAETWRLYFGFVKSLMMVVASPLYILMLTAFFLAQNLAFLTGKMAGWVVDWSPERPRAFRMNPTDGD